MGTMSPGTSKKTDILLERALLRLLEKKNFKKISVNDICQEAMVSRSAFYQHFQDKYELLSHCIDQELSVQRSINKNLSMEQALENLLKAIQHKQKMMYNMFRAELNQELMEIFLGVFQRHIQEWLEDVEAKGMKLSAPAPVLTAFLSGGLANMAVGWVQENYATPREELAACQCALLRRMVGV